MKDESTLDTTVDEWRAEFEHQDDPGATTREIADETGVGLRTAAARINKMLKSGRCKQGSATRIDSMGRRQRVPVYQLVLKKKEEQ